MKLSTVEQRLAVMTALAANADWDVLDADSLQENVVANAKKAGRQFTAFLRAGAVMPPRWREESGVIRFRITSDGTTGSEWTNRLEKGGHQVTDYAKSVLCSPDFKPTKGVSTEIAVLKGEFFRDEDRTTEKIRAEAGRRKWNKPNAEAGCLIREMFSDEEIEAMGLWAIIAMHDAIADSDGNPVLLGASRYYDYYRLRACYGRPDRRWLRGNGFAFAVSQVSI